MDWVWDAYDDLSDRQRVGLGVAATLVLAASALYFLGAASLVALSRYAPTASAEAPVALTLTPTAFPVATEVNPISPLLAERTPSPRPTATVSPTRGPATSTPTRTVTPTRAGSPTAAARPGGSATPTRVGAASTPTRTIR